MPKENIHDMKPSAPDTTNTVVVGWNETGWVQLSVAPPKWETTGDWLIVDLDRDGVNRAIRSLRKARDRAFGQDA